MGAVSAQFLASLRYVEDGCAGCGGWLLPSVKWCGWAIQGGCSGD